MSAALILLCGIGFVGCGLSGVMMMWHALQIARLGHLRLLTNSFRFFDQRQHPPAVQPHVRSLWRWFGSAALSFALFGIGVVLLPSGS